MMPLHKQQQQQQKPQHFTNGPTTIVATMIGNTLIPLTIVYKAATTTTSTYQFASTRTAVISHGVSLISLLALLTVWSTVVSPTLGLPLRRLSRDKNVTPVSVEGREMLLCWVVQIQTHVLSCGDNDRDGGGSRVDCSRVRRRLMAQHAMELSRELDLEIHHTFGQFQDHLLLCLNPKVDQKPLYVAESVNNLDSPMALFDTVDEKATSAGISQLHKIHSSLKAKDKRLFRLWREVIELKLARHPEVVTFSMEHVHRRKSRLRVSPRKIMEMAGLGTSQSHRSFNAAHISFASSSVQDFDSNAVQHSLSVDTYNFKPQKGLDPGALKPVSALPPHVSSAIKHAQIIGAKSSGQPKDIYSLPTSSRPPVHSRQADARVLPVPSMPKPFIDSSIVFLEASIPHKDHTKLSSIATSRISSLLLHVGPSSQLPSPTEIKRLDKNDVLLSMAEETTDFTVSESQLCFRRYLKRFLSFILQSLAPKSSKIEEKRLNEENAVFSKYQTSHQVSSSQKSPVTKVIGTSHLLPAAGLSNGPLSLSLLQSRQKRSAVSTSSVRALKNFEKLYSADEALTRPHSYHDRMETLHLKHGFRYPESQGRRRERAELTLYSPMTFNDPAYPRQWHLYNRATPGMDINVTGVWLHNITGRGVTVAVVDDGMEWRNPDLRANYNYKGSWDLNDNDPDPSPSYSKMSNHHGTRCAGEIAAVANNHVCGVGVAYGANVAGVRVLDGVMTDSMEAEAFNKNMDVNAIFSCSWGPDDDGATVDGPHMMAAKAMKFGVDFGRGGFGSIFVVASGNGGENFDNCNYDGYANSIYTVTIGAVDEDGGMPYYAEECASMLGVTFSSGTSNKRDIVTTDWEPSLNAGGERRSGVFDLGSVGGERGTNSGDGGVSGRSSSGGGMHRAASSLDGSSSGGCTERHTGTSAAAPLAAGMIALMLEARPCLTWRDVQYIVALTARKVDVDVAHWQKNGAGLSHSHKHGFGLLNAWRLVNAARVWRTVPWLTSYSFTEERSDWQISKGRRNPLTISHTVTSRDIQGLSLFIIEHVQLTVWLVHPWRGKVEVKVISPVGTTSMLAAARPKDNSSNGFNDWTFTSVRCWGETPTGEWTIVVTDLDEKGKQELGTLSKYRLTLFGTPMTPEEFSERRKVVELAMAGEFLHQNYNLHCPPPPKYESVYAPVTDRILKILILSGIFLVIMAIYETLEYLFCYDDEKKEAREKMRSARHTAHHAALMARETVADQELEQRLALLAQQPSSDVDSSTRNSHNSFQDLASPDHRPNSQAVNEEEEEEDDVSETSNLLRSQRDRDNGGVGLHLVGRTSRDLSEGSTLAGASPLQEVIPLSTFSVQKVSRSRQSEEMEHGATECMGNFNVDNFE